MVDERVTHSVIPEATLLFIMHLKRAIAITPRTRTTNSLSRLLFIPTLLRLNINPLCRLTPDFLLLITIHKPILSRHTLHLSISKERHIKARLDIRDLLQIPLREYKIDLLKRTLLRLRVEEIDDRKEACVHDSEEEVSSPFDICDHDGRDHNDEEVEQPVRASRDSVGFCTGSEWVDFCGVEPRERQPCCAEEGDVSEETDTCSFGGRSLSAVGDQAGEDEDHGEALADCANEEELAATGALDDEPGDCGENGVYYHVDASEEKSKIVSCAD